MFKLIIRSKPMIALGVLIAIGAPTGAYFILKGMTDKLIELHMAAVIAAIIILPIVVTLVAYQMTTAAQKVKVCSLMIGIVLILSSIDNFVFPQMRLLADSVLLFNWIAFVVNLAAGIAATFCLVTAVPDSVYGDGVAGAEKEDPKEKKRREQEEKEAEKAMSQTGSNAVRSTIARMPAINAENMVLKAAEETTVAKIAAEAHPATGIRDEERKAGSTSATNLKGLLDTLAPEDDDVASTKPAASPVEAPKPEAKAPVKSMLKLPPKPDSPVSQLTKPGIHATPAPSPALSPAPTPAPSPTPAPTQEAPKAEEKTPPLAPAGENKDGASATTRLQAQKRKGTSTFTKLQALSASGGVGNRADKAPGGEGEGLKSILDRLDSTAETTEEAPMDSLFGGGRLVTSRTDIPVISEAEDADTNLSATQTPTASTTPASPPSQLKRPGLGVTLGGGIKPRPEPAPTPVAPAAVTPQAAPEPLPSAPATPLATESATAGGESISDLLNSIQTPSILNKDSGLAGAKPPSGGLGSSGLGSTALGKAASTNKIGLGSLGSTSSTNLTPVRDLAEETAPELLQPAVAPVADEPILEEAVPEPAHSDETPAKEVAAAPAVEDLPAEDDDSSSIFAKGLDQEIDDIFSNLVPEEAQKEVKDAGVRASLEETSFASTDAETEEVSQPTTQPATVQEEEESEGRLFKGLDQELDDIFSNLVPAEAQREVDKSDVAQAPVATLSVEASEVTAEDDDSEQSSLFGKSLDSELDDIFSNLAPDEAQKKVTSETLAQVRGTESASTEEKQEELSFAPPPAATEIATAPNEASIGGKFVDTLGNLPALDAAKLPVQLSAKDASATSAANAVAREQTFKSTETAEHPVLEETSAEAAAGTPVKEIKEFGRLSARVSATAKTNETPGTMKTIGKLLIDVQAVENVIRNGETGQIGKNLSSARVLSAQRGEGIQMMLNKIDAYPGIAGSLIVGHDGLVIASTLKGDMDRDSLGVLSVACLSTSNLGTRKLEIGKLKQMVMITNTTVSVLTDVDVGILAVFMSAVEIDKIDGLLETIQTTIHG